MNSEQIQTNKIFLDFDETLASSIVVKTEEEADKWLYDNTHIYFGDKFELDGIWYVSFKRNITDKLISFCRQLVGVEHVNILTTATRDYILKCNELLNLGFEPHSQLYDRSDINKYNSHYPHPVFSKTYNVLVDNLMYNDHCHGSRCKVKFLGGLPYKQYVQINEYHIMDDYDLDTSSYYEELTSTIINAFN